MKSSSSILLLCLAVLLFPGCISEDADQGWDALPAMLEHITPPSFPDTSFSVLAFGALGDGETDCTRPFADAIQACSDAGGGTVIVPPGRYHTGAIHLRSNVCLEVQEGAVILFSTDPKDYLPLVLTRWEGVEVMNYSPLIYAYGQENMAITGSGILDGQGANENWWSWKGSAEYGWMKGMPRQKEGRDSLFAMAERGVPVEDRLFGEGAYLRPSFVQPYKSRNILIEGVTFRDSPMWFINPVLSQNITVKNVRIEGLGPNNDGCNPESSKDVLITDCYFNTGDDCIAIKAGRNADGRRINVPSENIIVRNSVMKEGHGGVVIGSEMTGGVRNVYVENCEMDSPNLDRALRIKTNAVRGGFVENVFFRNVSIGQVKEAVLKINFHYEEGENGSYLPSVKNIQMDNVTSNASAYGIWIRGFETSRPTGIRLSDCSFSNVEKGNYIEHVGEVVLTDVTVNGSVITTADLFSEDPL